VARPLGVETLGIVRRVVSFAVGVAVLVIGLIQEPVHLPLVLLGVVLMGLISLEELAAAFHRRRPLTDRADDDR
jgi:hypothetical protein